ncbi:hypothetical protein EDB80DRAFT_872516 [Ilyonectria destructans]|nr:hypothetical protein EDB80DRAFT_872516 [Ilyonectria destructans]
MASLHETPVLDSITAFNQIKQNVDWCEGKLEGIQSPAQKHKVDVETTYAKLDTAWKHVFQSTDLSKRPQLQMEVQNRASELEMLELNYRITLKDAEARYRREIDNILGDFCKKLGKSVSALLNLRENEVPQESAPNDSCRGYTSEPQPASDPLHSQVGAVPQRNIDRNAETRKRKRGMNQQEPDQATAAHISNKVKRSIHFEEIFQKGNARVKHTIVQWPPNQGDWFIIRCDDHDFNFKDNPLVGGMAHMRGRKHGKKPNYNEVVELLGTNVLGCNESLAQKNNAVARAGFMDRSEHHIAENIEVNLGPVLPQLEGHAPEARARVSPVADSDNNYMRRGIAPEYAQSSSSSASSTSISQEERNASITTTPMITLGGEEIAARSIQPMEAVISTPQGHPDQMSHDRHFETATFSPVDEPNNRRLHASVAGLWTSTSQPVHQGHIRTAPGTSPCVSGAARSTWSMVGSRCLTTEATPIVQAHRSEDAPPMRILEPATSLNAQCSQREAPQCGDVCQSYSNSNSNSNVSSQRADKAHSVAVPIPQKIHTRYRQPTSYRQPLRVLMPKPRGT